VYLLVSLEELAAGGSEEAPEEREREKSDRERQKERERERERERPRLACRPLSIYLLVSLEELAAGGSEEAPEDGQRVVAAAHRERLARHHAQVLGLLDHQHQREAKEPQCQLWDWDKRVVS
jgi:hypothetical protein